MTDLFEILFSAAMTARRKGSMKDIEELKQIVEALTKEEQPTLFGGEK